MFEQPSETTRRTVLLAGAAVAALALAGCGTGKRTHAAAGEPGEGAQVSTASPSPSAGVTTPRRVLSCVVYGDSLTAGHRHGLSYGAAPADSWLAYTGPSIVWVGGAAVSGATAARLPQMLTPTPMAEYAVYFFGTNDRRGGRKVADLVTDVAAAYKATPADVRPRRVCLVAIGPQGDPRQSRAVDRWNRKVAKAAADRGWAFIDPWSKLRASSAHGGDAQWISPTMHRDVLHPTTEGAQILGQGMADALLALPRPKR